LQLTLPESRTLCLLSQRVNACLPLTEPALESLLKLPLYAFYPLEKALPLLTKTTRQVEQATDTLLLTGGKLRCTTSDKIKERLLARINERGLL